ncbi:transposase [Streptomyces sp. CSDS2]|uniref:IS110 family transposase n=1 Tax=Streptomyces sp. CSDS2 TaxID=3055051 RepID=UPI0025B246D7|nr:transposase [Streptomyces sp. CSDS2]MDN3263271.1 transposase [Streptomyces sp. CSDS2]
MTIASMPQPTLPAQPEEPLAEDVILGVDTHKDVHAAVITVLGAFLAHQEFPATGAGYRQLLSWTRSFGTLHRAGVECTGSYGAALARLLSRESVQVVEVNQPDRAIRRKRGKSDAVDAEAAARVVLSGRADVTPKTGEGPAADSGVHRAAGAEHPRWGPGGPTDRLCSRRQVACRSADAGRGPPGLLPGFPGSLPLPCLHNSEDDEGQNGDPEQQPERNTVESLVGQYTHVGG